MPFWMMWQRLQRIGMAEKGIDETGNPAIALAPEGPSVSSQHGADRKRFDRPLVVDDRIVFGGEASWRIGFSEFSRCWNLYEMKARLRGKMSKETDRLPCPKNPSPDPPGLQLFQPKPRAATGT